MLAIHHPDGSQERFAYDAAGRLIGHQDANGARTRYRLDALGRPVLRQDALGGQLAYQWDPAGRLTALTNENGAQTRFQYDTRDRLIEERGFDGKTSRYAYNGAGELSETIEAADCAAPRRTVHERDGSGRLIRKTSGQGGHPAITDYAYDAAGQLILARNQASRIEFAYDARGQLIRETSRTGAGAQTLTHELDALGNRSSTRLPDGRKLNWLSYGSGHLHQINIDGQTICDIERDGLHREIERTQGALTSRYALDAQGRLVSQRALRSERTAPTGPTADKRRPLIGAATIERSYAYDAGGQLLQVQDRRRGRLAYSYDAIGRLTRALHGDGQEERFAFDPAHNLTERHSRRIDQESFDEDSPTPAAAEDWDDYVRRRLPEPAFNPLTDGARIKTGACADNRLTVFEDKRYAWDAHGNLVEKRIGQHTIQRYAWDAQGQLAEVQVSGRHGATRTRYAYDALGRRTAKRHTDAQGREQVTGFVWDGNRLLLERSGSADTDTERSRLYLYEPDSFVPLALVDAVGGGAP
ncbi:MAG: hypothetical protein WCF44_20605, partial [Candidatus Methylophosphatis roskildensis]